MGLVSPQSHAAVPSHGQVVKRLLAIGTGSFLLVVAACNPSPGEDYQVWIDPAFEGQTDTIFQALDDWRRSTDNGVQFHTWLRDDDASGQTYVIAIHRESTADIQTICRNPKVIGCTISNAVEVGVWANIYLPAPVKLQVALHELGHGMGLVHTGPGTVMCKDEDCASPDITCADVQQYYWLRPHLVAPDCLF